VPEFAYGKFTDWKQNYSDNLNCKKNNLLIINTSTTYALNKIHSEASIKLLHVSAPGCHHKANTRIKNNSPR
jgi:hypothetical protein